jgi:hypothetical protein
MSYRKGPIKDKATLPDIEGQVPITGALEGRAYRADPNNPDPADLAHPAPGTNVKAKAKLTTGIRIIRANGTIEEIQ